MTQARQRRTTKPAVGLQPEAEVNWSSYRGVLVVVEHRIGKARTVSWQLLGEGRRLADKLGAPLMALVIGHEVQGLAREAIGYGADRVFVCDSPELRMYRTRPYSRICLHVIRTYRPEIVLIGATYNGRDLAGAIATHVPTGLTADCTQLDVDENRVLLASRPAFSEKLIATIVCKVFKPQMATARSGVFQALPFDSKRQGEIIQIPPQVDPARIMTEVLEFIESKGNVNLEDADVIVAGGRGVGGKAGFDLLQQLAVELGGVVGASRPAVELGWISHDHQVGQTGATVRPKLYIAAGISGAVQHVVGMEHSQCIVSINQDPDAPIHKIADYAIVGDLFQVIPAFIQAVKARKAGRIPVKTERR
jgi:electron transfer flavoprotein alpha subunit